MAHTRNAPLAARIAELGLTEHELSDLLNDAVERMTGRRGKSTDRYVRLLLDGSIRWPWLVNRRALEQVLGKSILELGFIPRGYSSIIRPSQPECPAGIRAHPGAHPGAHRATPRAAHEATKEETMERREVLGIAAGASVSIMVPAVPEQGRVGCSDVGRMRAPLAELVGIDQRLGGVSMAPVCVRQAERILAAIRRCDASDRVQRAMYAVAGEYLAAAGWACVDAMELDQAAHHLDRALRAAHTAQDPMLAAKVTNIVVMRAREAGDFPYAHIMSGSGMNSTAARMNPRVNALFHARLAHGHGHRGELGMAQRELARAHDALDRVTPDTPTPPWLRFFNQAELAALAAMTYQALGRYRLATERGTLAASSVLPGYVRNQTLYTLGLAEAQLGEREVEQAAATATTGLKLAGQLRDGVRRGRAARQLRRLRERFRQWPEVSEARGWIAAYDQAHHQAHDRAHHQAHDRAASQ